MVRACTKNVLHIEYMKQEMRRRNKYIEQEEPGQKISDKQAGDVEDGKTDTDTEKY